MSKRIPQKRKLMLAALAAASLAVPRAALSTGSVGASETSGASATVPGADTAYGGYHGDSNAAGTGMGKTPGRGGSSLDSAYGRDTLWSSPYDQPATPGTGLPNSSGAGRPGTGGSGMGNDSSGNIPGLPGTPAAPGNNGATPNDSAGASDMMERG